MATAWRPDGYPVVSPYLVCTGAQRVLDFLAAAFGATPLRRYEMPDGSIAHAEARIGDSVVMIGEAGGDWAPTPCHVHVYVDDVDRVYAAALAAGGTSIQEPAQREGDPDRRGGVMDPAGNSWWIGTQRAAGG